jgi:hypothetical protein
MDEYPWTDINVDPPTHQQFFSGFFDKLIFTGIILVVAAVGYGLSSLMVYCWLRDNEIAVEDYAVVQTMDNSVTHEYIMECLENGVITRGEFREIRNMLEKYPVIEQVTRRHR